MKYYVYILKSESLNWYYVGHTKNIKSRLERHNKGLVRSTKGRIPYKLVYTETFETKSEAYMREMEIKANYLLKTKLLKEASSSNG